MSAPSTIQYTSKYEVRAKFSSCLKIKEGALIQTVSVLLKRYYDPNEFHEIERKHT